MLDHRFRVRARATACRFVILSALTNPAPLRAT
jgi:hypothetical protein